MNAHASGSTPAHVPHGHKFPAERWERLVSPERHRLLDPVRMLDDLDVRSGMAVADVALLAFVLHELSHPLDFLSEVRRILRPGGRLAVLEWVPKDEPIGPPLAERMSEEHASEVLAAGGFTVTRRGDANRSQYFVVAEPAA